MRVTPFFASSLRVCAKRTREEKIRMAEKRVALAVGAHPDDVEFMMAGTLSLLAKAGFEPHILTVANGSCGTAEHG